ncbi:hypothetical protein LZ32DRAFT_381923 [Colletotrichum eremochloae]|nr:hypothetical protein LZ32DRAFT_381923 [Colletotrichum eremochloae]
MWIRGNRGRQTEKKNAMRCSHNTISKPALKPSWPEPPMLRCQYFGVGVSRSALPESTPVLVSHTNGLPSAASPIQLDVALWWAAYVRPGDGTNKKWWSCRLSHTTCSNARSTGWLLHRSKTADLFRQGSQGLHRETKPVGFRLPQAIPSSVHEFRCLPMQ